MTKFLRALALLLLAPVALFGQDDLLAELEAEAAPATVYTQATWKGTKVVNLETNELPAAGVLQYSILHRFGAFNQSFFHNFLGLHNAQVRLSLDYSPTDWLNLGLSNTGVRKTSDAYAKYRLLRQSTGEKNSPVSITGFSGVYFSAQRFNDDLPRNTSDRFSFVNQLVIARKFTENFSAQLVPTSVHFNVVDARNDNNTVLILGLAGRYKLSHKFALTAEWLPRLNANSFEDADGQRRSYYNSLSLGLDIETGGHVFQLFFTNSAGVAQPWVFAQNTGSWLNNDIHFGFNISRVFTIVRPKEFR